MRLYLKLGSLAAAGLLLQVVIDAHHESIQEAIFAVRCWLAWTSGDEAQIERLVQEGQLRLRREQDDSISKLLARQRLVNTTDSNPRKEEPSCVVSSDSKHWNHAGSCPATWLP